ncbi:fimbrial protein [Burkholderia lata]|uniref:fimbrial protein n=1 Tax=Burkholderia lata (strain ATCC 17760 / DSM 23089 / LMG 22485 / NCIMB 9086 / R18194 / 383) TaxID=482957 RepID=UPI00399AF530
MRQSILAAVLFGVVASPAMSASPCTITDASTGLIVNNSQPVVYAISGYETPEFNPSVPAGTILDSRTITPTGNTVVMYCPYPGIQNVLNGKAGAVAEPVYNTYPTTVKGVGVRLRVAKNGLWWPHSFDLPASNVATSASPLLVEFVKTGPITSQGVLRGEFAGTWVRNGQVQFVSYQIIGGILIKPKVPTCSVATKRIDVQLSPSGNGFTTRDFNGVGSTTPERDFSIKLNCAGGDEGTSTNAYVTLTDNSNPGNRSNQLSLTPDSDASGFAVQVLKSGKVLSFGPDSSAAGNPNQWQAGNIPQGMGVFTIPLTARYIQTSTKVKGGMANAVATFTMSYQ